MKYRWINTVGNPGALRCLLILAVFVLAAAGVTAPAYADGNDADKNDSPMIAAGDIKVLDHDGDWIKVDMDDFEAWVMSDYLDIKKEQIPLDKEAEVFKVTGEPGVTPAAGVKKDDKAGADGKEKVAADENREQLSAYERSMRRAVDAIADFLNNVADRKDLSLKERMEKATEFIRYIRWGPEKEYYFWIVDVEGVMVLEPQFPHIEGRNVLSFKDLNKRHIFGEFINAALQDKYGYVEHHGLGYDDNKSNARLTIAKVFLQWEWVVGVGQISARAEIHETDELPINDHLQASNI